MLSLKEIAVKYSCDKDDLGYTKHYENKFEGIRNDVTKILEIGLNKRPFEDIRLIIESRDRSKAGFSVPAKGLFLTKIIYPSSVYLNNEK